uniref:Uncharacterized protein LOC107606916 n=1 Tax=Rhizophora mucronata TaxID=61149 RepID=A0A2P2JAA7_RHIMU
MDTSGHAVLRHCRLQSALSRRHGILVCRVCPLTHVNLLPLNPRSIKAMSTIFLAKGSRQNCQLAALSFFYFREEIKLKSLIRIQGIIITVSLICNSSCHNTLQ